MNKPITLATLIILLMLLTISLNAIVPNFNYSNQLIKEFTPNTINVVENGSKKLAFVNDNTFSLQLSDGSTANLLFKQQIKKRVYELDNNVKITVKANPNDMWSINVFDDGSIVEIYTRRGKSYIKWIRSYRTDDPTILYIPSLGNSKKHKLFIIADISNDMLKIKEYNRTTKKTNLVY